ncbi:MAG: hypothetical protein Tsb0021_03730 [Chlamydiales bacterium]
MMFLVFSLVITCIEYAKSKILLTYLQDSSKLFTYSLFMGVIEGVILVVLMSAISVFIAHKKGLIVLSHEGWTSAWQYSLKRIHKILALSLMITIATGIGYIFLIIPGVILSTALISSIPAFAVEEIRPTDAFNRSFELTKGQRWRIFGFLLVQMLVYCPIAFVIFFITNLLASPLLVSLVTALFQTFAIIPPCLLYFDLRAHKEAEVTADTHRLSGENAVEELA